MGADYAVSCEPIIRYSAEIPIWYMHNFFNNGFFPRKYQLTVIKFFLKPLATQPLD